MHWVVQNNIFNEDGHARLIEAIERYGSPYSLHKCVPFIGILDPEPIPTQDKVIVMGSYTLANKAQEMGWKPGAFVNENFNAEVWAAADAWDGFAWNGGRFTQFTTLREFAASTPSCSITPFFIRPVLDSKSFSGTVMDHEELREWCDKLSQLSPDDYKSVDLDTRVLVAPHKQPVAEYRVWMVKGTAVTASRYKLGRTRLISPEVAPEVLKFAETINAYWSPCEAYVMDVFQGSSGNLFVGEINNLNSAGFYAGDMNKLVGALEEAFG